MQFFGQNASATQIFGPTVPMFAAKIKWSGIVENKFTSKYNV